MNDQPDDADSPGRVATVTVQHWYMIPGGIEFEDANGRFVHVLLTEADFWAVHDHMERTGLRPAEPKDEP